jgi:hypothetical protein
VQGFAQKEREIMHLSILQAIFIGMGIFIIGSLAGCIILSLVVAAGKSEPKPEGREW